MRALLFASVAALLATSARAQDAPAARIFEPEVISTRFNEFGGVMSPDGQTFFVSMSVQPYYREETYVSSRRVDGSWSEPVLAPFSHVARNFDVTFSPDGQSILFVSDRRDRPDEHVEDYNIYEAHRVGAGWSAPVRLPSPISGARDGVPTTEHFASMAADGSVYFASDTRDGDPGMAIYVSRRTATGYGPAEKLGPAINATPFTGEPVIAPDQSFLLFSAFGREGAPGNWDISAAGRPMETGATPSRSGRRSTPGSATTARGSNRTDTLYYLHPSAILPVTPAFGSPGALWPQAWPRCRADTAISMRSI